MPSSSGLIKGVCAFLCIPIIGLIIFSILTYWRNIYATPYGSVDYLNVGKDQFFGLRSRSDKPVAFAGIIDNCVKNDFLFIGRLCDLPDGTGFVGETAIVWLLCIAAIIYAINFFIILGSIAFSKIAYILPIICFISTALIASAAIVFGICYNDIYKKDQKIVYERDPYGQTVEVVLDDDDDKNVTLPNKITFAIGFYLAIIAMVLSFVTMLLSVAAAVVKPKEEKPNVTSQPQQQQAAAGYQQQPQQQYQYYPQQQQQQGYPVQGYYPQQPAAQPYPYRPPQAYQDQTPPAYQPQQHQQGQQIPQQPGYVTPQQYSQPQQQQQVYTPPYSPAASAPSSTP